MSDSSLLSSSNGWNMTPLSGQNGASSNENGGGGSVEDPRPDPRLQRVVEFCVKQEAPSRGRYSEATILGSGDGFEKQEM